MARPKTPKRWHVVHTGESVVEIEAETYSQAQEAARHLGHLRTDPTWRTVYPGYAASYGDVEHPTTRTRLRYRTP